MVPSYAFYFYYRTMYFYEMLACPLARESGLLFSLPPLTPTWMGTPTSRWKPAMRRVFCTMAFLIFSFSGSSIYSRLWLEKMTTCARKGGGGGEEAQWHTREGESVSLEVDRGGNEAG